jgi:hypothetical protein
MVEARRGSSLRSVERSSTRDERVTPQICRTGRFLPATRADC